MGIGKLQGKLDEMVQWGGGRGEAGLQTLILLVFMVYTVIYGPSGKEK